MTVTSKTLLEQAIDVAHKWHAGQFRKCGLLPYIVHPIEVMKKLHSWGVCDEKVLAAAVLHDVLEDTKIPHDEVAEISERVYGLVLGMTHYNDGRTKKQYMESFRDKSNEEVLIKAADRLCNCADYEQTDPKYATVYFKKADVVWDRIQQIVETNTWENLKTPFLRAHMEIIDYL